MTVLVSWNLAMVTIALVNVSEVFLAKVSFNAGSFGFGLMWAGSGLGAVIGALFASSWLERRSMTVLYALAIAVMGLADIAAAASPNVWVAVWCVLVGGVGNATALVSNTLLVQRGAPDHVRGRAFTLIMGSNFAVLGVGMAAAGPLVDAVGARWVYGIAGGIAFLSAFTGYAMLRRAGGRVPEPAALEHSPSAGVDARDTGCRRARRRPPGARARDHAGRELRSARLRPRPRPLSADRQGLCDRDHRAARGREIEPDRALVGHVRGLERTAGVVSVDPSSPFSQGALLGDRIRLSDHFLDPGVFIRSMGTRGHLGGLAEATLQAMLILDASGKDVVFVETVGTGQSEIEVIGVADTVLLVLMPGSGDSIQALKAGIMEIPDVIAVNKMDHPAAKTMVTEVRSVLSLDRTGRGRCRSC